MKTAIRILLRSLLDLAYPSTCPWCERRLNHVEQTVCDDCRESLVPEDTWRCRLCGATGSGPAHATGPCPRCPPLTASYRGILSATRYGEMTARCIYDFKYHRRMEMGRVMSDLMVARLGEPGRLLLDRVSVVVPVPLHWTRRMWRGFNQSDVLGAALAEGLGIPMVHALRRVKRTKAQARISSKDSERRASNVRNAFVCADSFQGRLSGVLLVDDVVTTAHTVGECARILTQAGAPEVWIACFSRA